MGTPDNHFVNLWQFRLNVVIEIYLSKHRVVESAKYLLLLLYLCVWHEAAFFKTVLTVSVTEKRQKSNGCLIRMQT